MAGGSNARDPDTLEPCSDTVLVRVVSESVPQQCADEAVSARGFDPYSTNIGALAVPKTSRRTLDDMRRLSEQIKRNRASAS
jgi:hypothetical protein